METVRMCSMMAVFVLVISLLLPSMNAQGPAAAPAPSNDGAAIDQGVAYVLMLVALALTYIIH